MPKPRPPTFDEQFSPRASVTSVAMENLADEMGAPAAEESQGSGYLSGAVLLLGITCVVLGLILAVGGLQGTTVIGSLVGARDGVDDFAPGMLMTIFGVVSIYSRDWIGWPGQG